MNLLIIGHTIPEPTTTAAGGRMRQLIKLFRETGYDITFASTARPTEHSLDLETLGISSEEITLNDPSFDEFVQNLNPEVVLFDRFITEEQFGWRVAEQCPEAQTILDTEDLHFLRKARQEAVKNGLAASKADLYSEATKRELASILRCDLSLIISEAEMELLQSSFQIPKGILHYLPLLSETISDRVPPEASAEAQEKKNRLSGFEERSDFMTIGNFLHAPNADSVLFLKQRIWPAIRERLPEAQLHVYGAYAPQQHLELHKPEEGFYIKGWAPNVDEVMQKHHVCLAPLRFGAGLKGKLFDAMRNGTPVVTTTIGAEGMYGELDAPGHVTDVVDEFAKAAVELYSDKQQWTQAQKNGFKILDIRFERASFSEAFIQRIYQLRETLEKHRKQHFIGRILHHQSLQSTRYLSKWIESKNSRQ